MTNESSWADVWMTVMIGCESWGIKAIDPPMDWDDHPAHKAKPINTSYPLLFISNTLDPVTPLHAGLKMAKKFVDAGLVEQKSEGHCSLAAVSRCTIDKIRRYFRDGDVPPPPVVGSGEELKSKDGKWEKCEADEWPFHHWDGEAYLAANGEEFRAEMERVDAVKEMQEWWRMVQHTGQPDFAFKVLQNMK